MMAKVIISRKYGGKQNRTAYPLPTGLSNKKKNKGQNPEVLCMAISYGEVNEALKIISEGQIDINQPDSKGNCPLHSALHYDQLELAARLLSLKCDVNLLEEVTNLYPIHIAAHKSSPECLELLLEYNKKHLKDPESWTPIDLNVRDQTSANTALGLAAREGHLVIVKHLVQAGCDLDLANATGDTPLSVAISNGHADIVQLLLKNGAKLELAGKRQKEPLIFSCLNNTQNSKILWLLLEHGLDPNVFNKEGMTPLMHTLNWQQWDKLDILLDKKWSNILNVNLDSQNKHRTILHLIANSNKSGRKYDKYLHQLLERGTSVGATDIHGYQALDYAVQNKAIEKARILLNFNAKILTKCSFKEMKFPDQRIPHLVSAVQMGLEELVSILILYGAPVNADFYMCNSPLAISLENGRLDIAEMLLQAGCDVTKDKKLVEKLHSHQYESFLSDNPTLKAKLEHMSKNAPKLTNICRSVIRHHMYTNSRPLLGLLDLSQPAMIKCFLLCESMEGLSLKLG